MSLIKQFYLPYGQTFKPPTFQFLSCISQKLPEWFHGPLNITGRILNYRRTVAPNNTSPTSTSGGPGPPTDTPSTLTSTIWEILRDKSFVVTARETEDWFKVSRENRCSHTAAHNRDTANPRPSPTNLCRIYSPPTLKNTQILTHHTCPSKPHDFLF